MGVGQHRVKYWILAKVDERSSLLDVVFWEDVVSRG